jgi:asparagine N-glycosylation enzyme membrane subunit Stt3
MGGCRFPEHHRAPSGGSGGRTVLVLVLAVIAAAAARPAMRAAFDVLIVAAVVLGVVAGLAALAGLAVLAVRIRRCRAAGRRPAAYLETTAVVSIPQPRAAPRAALPAARGHVSAYPRDDVEAHGVTGRVSRPRCTGRGRR